VHELIAKLKNVLSAAVVICARHSLLDSRAAIVLPATVSFSYRHHTASYNSHTSF